MNVLFDICNLVIRLISYLQNYTLISLYQLLWKKNTEISNR